MLDLEISGVMHKYKMQIIDDYRKTIKRVETDYLSKIRHMALVLSAHSDRLVGDAAVEIVSLLNKAANEMDYINKG